jgi:hypothetical protein
MAEELLDVLPECRILVENEPTRVRGLERLDCDAAFLTREGDAVCGRK